MGESSKQIKCSEKKNKSDISDLLTLYKEVLRGSI